MTDTSAQQSTTAPPQPTQVMPHVDDPDVDTSQAADPTPTLAAGTEQPVLQPTQEPTRAEESAEADDESAEAVDEAAADVAEAAEAEDEAAEAEDEAAADDEPSDPLELEGEVAADYLEELLDIADLDGDIDTYVESGRAHVSIVTESDVLVGRNGEVLDALQELARLAVVTETGRRSRLMLDIAGHRDRRRTELVALATDAITEAKASGEQIRLAPMNAFERKIVHDAVAEAGLTSESEGEDPQRRVVIIP